MKVAVTGGLGFLGHFVTKSLLARGHSVHVIDKIRQGAISDKSERARIQRGWKITRWDVDLANIKDALGVVRKIAPDVIVHTAAQYSVKYTTEACERYVRNNLAAFTYLFEAAKVYRVRRLVYTSSFAVADDGRPSGLYGATKGYGEQCAHSYTKRCSIEAIGVRFGPIYGPLSRNDTHVYRALDQYLKRQPLSTHSEFLKGAPYVYVEDAGEVLADLATTAKLHQQHNVYLAAADEEYCSVADIVRVAERVQGAPAIWPPGVVPIRSTIRPDLFNLRLVLGRTPSTILEIGVPKMMEWMRCPT
jgi:UDP-glucuronate 4-epimerase